MLLNHIKFTLRGIGKNKIFSLVHILGLAISLLSCLFITQYALFEFSYDKFNDNLSNIYRVQHSRFIDGEFQYKKAQVFPAVGETLKQEVAQVKNFVRLFPINTHIETVFSVDDNGQSKAFHESSVYAADSTFLAIFTLPLVKGDSASALTGERKMILSETVAYKYFGDSDPINRTIHWNGMGDYIVTGVFKDLPINSHMKFDVLVSWWTVYGERSYWNWDSFFTYILLEPGSNRQIVEGIVQDVLSKKMDAAMPEGRVKSKFELQALSDIHLKSDLLGEMNVNGDTKIVLALVLVGILILIIAVINYTNLSLARVLKRTKEVGIRKVIGSTKGQLTNQFFVESLTINLIALFFAFLLFLLVQPYFDSLIGKQIDSIILNNPIESFGIILVALLIISFVSGVYPSRLLVAHNPTNALKGIYINPTGGSVLKRGLLTFQFLATSILIAVAIIIHQQVDFMRKKEMGFEINQKLIVRTLAGSGEEMDSLFNKNIETFKFQVKELGSVNNVTVTSNIPGRENEWLGRVQSVSNEEMIQMYRTRIDSNFFDTYKINIVAGKTTNTFKTLIINEAATKQLGYKKPEDAIGNMLFRDYEIVGVVNDYNERSLHTTVAPAMYTYGEGYMKFITVDIKSNLPTTIDFMEKKWSSIFPGRPFEYFFLDDFYNRQYESDIRLGNVFTIFAGLSIFIACLGLFGFSYFVVNQKIKEIGIRKILGASSLSLVKLLSSEFLLLILVASVLSIPLTYYLSSNWLSRYAYRIDIKLEHFTIPVLIVLSISIGTICLHLLKAIKSNPVESLKNDN
jgi:putative ABC transport system permease protein